MPQGETSMKNLKRLSIQLGCGLLMVGALMLMTPATHAVTASAAACTGPHCAGGCGTDTCATCHDPVFPGGSVIDRTGTATCCLNCDSDPQRHWATVRWQEGHCFVVVPNPTQPANPEIVDTDPCLILAVTSTDGPCTCPSS